MGEAFSFYPFNNKRGLTHLIHFDVLFRSTGNESAQCQYSTIGKTFRWFCRPQSRQGIEAIVIHPRLRPRVVVLSIDNISEQFKFSENIVYCFPSCRVVASFIDIPCRHRQRWRTSSVGFYRGGLFKPNGSDKAG